jgi:hypothetical protein
MINKLEGSLEENVLTMLAYSEIHAFELALQLDAEIFSTNAYRIIAEKALAHIEVYGEPPRGHLYDALEAKLRRGDEGILLKKTLDAMRELAAELQPEYVLKNLNRFIEKRKLSIAVETAADHIQADQLEEAREALSDTYESKPSNHGIWLHDPKAMLGFMVKKEEDAFLTGIEELDRRGIVPVRGRFMLFLAPPKKGKSWFLIKVARANLAQRKSVLHITLENSADETSQRYVQSFFSLTETEEAPAKIPRFLRSETSRIVRDIKNEMQDKPFENLKTIPKARLIKKLKGFQNRARLRIEAFPSGVLTIGMLNSLLDKLERVDNFKPEVLIIDAPYLMEIDPKNLRISLGQLFVKLKGLCAQRNLALVGVGQGSKEAALSKTMNSTMIAEDYSAIATVDCVLTYSCTLAERKSGLARLLVAACRYAKDGFMVLISQHYPTGQFALDSTYFGEHVEGVAERLVKEQKEEDPDADSA